MKPRAFVLLGSLLFVLTTPWSSRAAAQAGPAASGPFAMKAKVTMKAGGHDVPLKLEEKVAFMFVTAIANLEDTCSRHVNRPCTMQELVNRPKSADGWDMQKLKFDPTKTDPNYTYAITISGDEWAVSVTPKKAGLAGFYNAGGAAKLYYNPKGAAAATDQRVTDSLIDGDSFQID